MAELYGEKVFGERTYEIEGATLPTAGQYLDAGTEQNGAVIASLSVNANKGRGLAIEQFSRSPSKAVAKSGIMPYLKQTGEAHTTGDPLTRSQITAGALRKALPGEPILAVVEKDAASADVRGWCELIPGGGTLTLSRQVVKTMTGLTANAEMTDIEVPAGYRVDALVLRNTTANAVTILVGTTAGGNNVVASVAVGANAILDATLLLREFSFSAVQALFISSSSWSSANLTAYAVMTRLV